MTQEAAAEWQAPPTPDTTETRRQRLSRNGRKVRLYTWLVLFVGVLIVLIVLIGANIRTVELDWVFGSTRASLVWIILGAVVLGWLLGIATSVLVRHRTRAPAA